jgi:hypothetical protein
MKLNKNGAIIENVTNIDNSTLSADYIVMWDDEGIPIHINKEVILRLYNKIQISNPNDSVFC